MTFDLPAINIEHVRCRVFAWWHAQGFASEDCRLQVEEFEANRAAVELALADNHTYPEEGMT